MLQSRNGGEEEDEDGRGQLTVCVALFAGRVVQRVPFVVLGWGSLGLVTKFVVRNRLT